MAKTAEAPRTTEHHPVALPDAWRVEVFRRDTAEDPEGALAASTLVELGLPLSTRSAVHVGRGYLLSPSYERATIERIAADFLSDPVTTLARITPPGRAPESRAERRILVMPRPGVMDPVASTVERLLEDLGCRPANGAPRVATFRVFEIHVLLDALELGRAARTLGNETIEIVRVGSEDLPYGAAFAESARGRVEVKLLALGDEELLEASERGVLSLNLIEMRAIQGHFAALGREPSACELETIAQTWSEHCKHKTLTGIIEFERADGTRERIDNLLASTIARATHELARPWCVSVFKDNAGIVEFDQGLDLAIKVETHNHPSAIDPYGGAGTGVGGVVRDVLGAGLGARPIANLAAFFVGPPDLEKERLPKGSLHPRRILRGVVAGVRDYGNRMGIPTVAGGVWFDAGYTANPLVFCGTIGILPRAAVAKEVTPGDVIVAVGGRTGRDGIHGATFSSAELHEESETLSSGAVQIGDPITEKRVLDCLMQARDQGLYRGITDCGAGGFSSAVGEMGAACGAEVELEHVPLKYPGLSSHEIWISEAQERMVLAVPPENVERLLALFRAEDVEATVIGRFTSSGRLVVKDRGEIVADLGMHFLHEETPRPVRRAHWRRPALADPGVPAVDDARGLILGMLAHPDVASKAWIVRQYDHEVQGASVVKALVGERGDGPSDAAVLQPLARSEKGCAIACGANPSFGVLDPSAMAACAIDEAVRNAVAVGADPERCAILDNFAWGNCDKPDRLGSLVLAAQACYEVARAYGTPFVSGKDSLNNEYQVGGETLAVPPTLLVTALALVPSVRRAVTMDWKRAGSSIYLVGATKAELGGSLYFRLRSLRGGCVPQPDLELAPRIFRALHAAISNGWVLACHDLSEGGLALAAAEMAFAGSLGAELDLERIPIALIPFEGTDARIDRDATRLFSESASRFLVEVETLHAARFEGALSALPCTRLGPTTPAQTLVFSSERGGRRVELSIEELRGAFHSSFQG